MAVSSQEPYINQSQPANFALSYPFASLFSQSKAPGNARAPEMVWHFRCGFIAKVGVNFGLPVLVTWYFRESHAGYRSVAARNDPRENPEYWKAKKKPIKTL